MWLSSILETLLPSSQGLPLTYIWETAILASCSITHLIELSSTLFLPSCSLQATSSVSPKLTGLLRTSTQGALLAQNNLPSSLGMTTFYPWRKYNSNSKLYDLRLLVQIKGHPDQTSVDTTKALALAVSQIQAMPLGSLVMASVTSPGLYLCAFLQTPFLFP